MEAEFEAVFIYCPWELENLLDMSAESRRIAACPITRSRPNKLPSPPLAVYGFRLPQQPRRPPRAVQPVTLPVCLREGRRHQCATVSPGTPSCCSLRKPMTLCCTAYNGTIGPSSLSPLRTCIVAARIDDSKYTVPSHKSARSPGVVFDMKGFSEPDGCRSQGGKCIVSVGVEEKKLDYCRL